MPKRQSGVSDFVKTQPLDAPIADVMAAAKKVGLKLHASSIYKARAEMRAASSKATAKARRPAEHETAFVVTNGGGNGAAFDRSGMPRRLTREELGRDEAVFVALAIRLGHNRAIELFQNIEDLAAQLITKMR